VQLREAVIAAERDARREGASMRTIEAGTLRLEPQVEAHAEEMFAVLCDPAIYTWENAPPPSLAWLRERFRKLESRTSADGTEQWLNWVVRIPPRTPIGYVQATVRADGSAAIAYEFASAYWGRGLAQGAARAMMHELAQRYGVTRFVAIAKHANLRSARLLERLGFAVARAQTWAEWNAGPDEIVMAYSTAREAQ
jgi:RimJ/RimL family protein N-acetyltransferase